MSTGITARDKKLLYMLGLIVIAALFFIIGIRPLNRKIAAIEDKLDEEQVLHDTIKMKIYQLDMVKGFKVDSENMTNELSSRYYERQVAADIDKLITNKALGYGLKVNNLSIQTPKEPVALMAYQNSEAWAAKQSVIEAAQSLEEDAGTENVATTKDDTADKKKDKNKDKDSANVSEQEGMVDIDALASINNEYGMYNIEDTTGADVYAASLTLDVYGSYDKAKALLDEIINNNAFRVTSYEWGDSTSLPYEYVDGELVQVVTESGSRLVVSFEMYMYDGTAFQELTEGNAGNSEDAEAIAE